jgi:hypothetical protein
LKLGIEEKYFSSRFNEEIQEIKNRLKILSEQFGKIKEELVNTQVLYDSKL